MTGVEPKLSHAANGAKKAPLKRADEVSELLAAVEELLIPFIREADEDAAVKEKGHGLATKGGGPRTTLVEHHPPQKLAQLLDVQLPDAGQGKDGLLDVLQEILKYSVNTWDLGFLDKLYASTNAVGVASELILAVLNTNVHVYQVSPALTLIEKRTTRELASLFGFQGPHAGGIAQQGGSASNTTSIVIARNSLFPETKVEGNGGYKFVLFTSVHGHYSIEKAAQISGFGSANVWSVPVDSNGCMDPSALDSLVQKAKDEGRTPFYVNATAGTTVLGSYDPFNDIADVCQKHQLWMHIDGSWGGPVIFSRKQKAKLAGCERADSLAVTPHKMMGVPLTCSFLLGKDMRVFHRANTLRAGYLFHTDHASSGDSNGENSDVWDLADLTLQCGRKGDGLKLALGWIYYGKAGYEESINRAFDTAGYMADQILESNELYLVSSCPPPCLQVCFYYAPQRKLSSKAEENTQNTASIARSLITAGFMIDYAPDPDRGSFFRVVVNGQTRKDTINGLLKAVITAGENRQ
ncbi:MAG: hypothetical protein M4579_006267 [Chaenotheca gracillima]|nr:MAG: hypothetical protein M4579_006267 [Chaenotheca gracillima]